MLKTIAQHEQVSNQTLEAMLENNEAHASRVSAELQEMRSYLEGEGERESSLFLKVLQVCSLFMLTPDPLKSSTCMLTAQRGVQTLTQKIVQ